MNKLSFFAFFILSLSHFYPTLKAQAIYSNAYENHQIGGDLEILVDSNSILSITEVLGSSAFRRSSSSVPHLGIIPFASVWAKISLKNETDVSNLILQVNQPIIDEVELYVYDEKQKTYSVTKMGEYQSFSIRKYITPEYLFDLSINKNETKVYYLKIKSKENMQLPISVGTPLSLFNTSVLKNLASGVYIGIMFAMMLYNLFIFLSVRDKSYLYYTVYIIFILLTQTTLQGYPFQFLWPDIPWIAIHGPFIFPALVGIAALEFFKEFLRLKTRTPKLNMVSNVFIVIYIAAVTVGISGFYGVGYQIIEINAGLVSIYMLILSFKIYFKGHTEARFFLVGWAVFLTGICIFVLKDFDILPYNNFTRYTMHFGSGIEVILLSFALADRINILKQEKEASQAQVLIALQENEQLTKEQNLILEQKVRERTTELNLANQDLNKTLKDLKNTQAQLVSAEKMASLGQLTAGIAHEINNPINFVSANIKPLQMDVADIMEVISKYESLTGSDQLVEKLEEIDVFKKKIDLEYTKGEIKTLLAGIEDGARRTAEIVTGLKTFSRLDESDVKTANINDGIESTLTMIRSAIPPNIKVVKNLEALPIIECFPGKLNQVFMNTFNNAIHAIEETKVGGTLTISSYVLNEDYICVSVQDTGIGMTPETKVKIFEPFFTTKDVGQGTGLGMSIVFTIIQSHKGTIDIESEFGKGTKIIFTIPIKLEVS